jgi:hypothetical protein
MQNKTSQIRKIVASEYDFYFAFNDSLKTTRKLKYMQNGGDHGQEFYDRATTAIRSKLDAAGIQYIYAGFDSCFRENYGSYFAFVVRYDRAVNNVETTN